MVTLSNSAGELLQRVQQDQGLTEPPRLVRQADQFAITISPSDPRDEVLYYGDQPVLRVAPEVADSLAGCTIAAQETATGSQLAIIQERSPDGRFPDAGAD